jgi:hypothetical protein
MELKVPSLEGYFEAQNMKKTKKLVEARRKVLKKGNTSTASGLPAGNYWAFLSPSPLLSSSTFGHRHWHFRLAILSMDAWWFPHGHDLLFIASAKKA